MVDTESFVYETEAVDFYGNNIKDVDANFDTSGVNCVNIGLREYR